MQPRGDRCPPCATATTGAPCRTIAEALHAWLLDHVARISAVSDLVKAIRTGLRYWPGLIVFLEHGRIEMDTNVVQGTVRPHQHGAKPSTQNNPGRPPGYLQRVAR